MEVDDEAHPEAGRYLRNDALVKPYLRQARAVADESEAKAADSDMRPPSSSIYAPPLH